MKRADMGELLTDLLELCKVGNDRAVAELIGRYQPWAIRFAVSMLRNDDLAQDAVQEAFITVLRRLPDLRSPEAFPAWLRQIVRTEVNRIQRRRSEIPLDEGAQVADGALSASEQMEREERCRQVREAVASLPPRERETVELFYLEERGIGDISSQLAIPSGTVKRRLHDARKNLRRILTFGPNAIEPPAKPKGNAHGNGKTAL